MNPSRRRFLKSTGLGFLALGLPPAFLVRAAEAQQAGKGKVMVVVFQRGAMDGLNAVIPFKDAAYYTLKTEHRDPGARLRRRPSHRPRRFLRISPGAGAAQEYLRQRPFSSRSCSRITR